MKNLFDREALPTIEIKFSLHLKNNDDSEKGEMPIPNYTQITHCYLILSLWY